MTNYSATKREFIDEITSMRQRLVELEKLGVEEEHTQQMLHDLVTSSHVAVCIVQDSVFKLISPQLLRLTGYAEYQLLGMNPLDLVLPNDRSMVQENAAKMLRGERSSGYEYRIISKNGKIRWVMETVVPVSYEGSQAILATNMDISETKLAQEKHLGNLELFHDLCENADDMIQCISPEGRFTYVNRSWLEKLGYSKEAIPNLSLLEIVHPDYQEHCLEVFKRVVSEGISGNIEAVFVSKSGNNIPVEGSINCKLVDDKAIYTRGVFRDITERKRTEEDSQALLGEVKEINRRLEQSNRELEDFAYIASHDLQEPLRKISSFGTLLQESLNGKLDDDELENLDFMIDGAKRMQKKVDDLLAYSRITTRAKPLQQVDLNDIVEGLKKFELANLLEDTGGSINVPQPLIAVNADLSQMHDLLQNLIGNGLKFHQDGVPPVITIRTSRMPEKMVRLEVQDNGIGISEEYHEQIFTMFKRLHSIGSYPGTGIGLAICKKIVNRHGGNIEVTSTDGKGSTFWCTLPRFS